MKEKRKTKILMVLLILAIIIIMIMGYLIYKFYNEKLNKENDNIELNNKIVSLTDTVTELQDKINIDKNSNKDTSDDTSDKNSSSNKNTSNTTSDKNKIIKDVSFIEISVLDENGQGLEYTNPVQIENKDSINYLVDELNNSEKLSEEYLQKNWISFEACPILTFNLENGSTIEVVGSKFSGPYENKFVFQTSTKWDNSDSKVYKLNSSTDLLSYINELYEKNK